MHWYIKTLPHSTTQHKSRQTSRRFWNQTWKVKSSSHTITCFTLNQRDFNHRSIQTSATKSIHQTKIQSKTPGNYWWTDHTTDWCWFCCLSFLCFEKIPTRAHRWQNQWQNINPPWNSLFLNNQTTVGLIAIINPPPTKTTTYSTNELVANIY